MQYNIEEILVNAGKLLRPVRKTLGAKGLVIGPLRKLMMRTLVNHLFYDEKG